MAAPSQEPWQQQLLQAHEIIPQDYLATNSLTASNSRDLVSSEPSELSLSASHADATTIERKAKRQPWQAVWPAPREPASQANIFGFEKGEVMIFDGNAGNFFARDAWTIEQEVDHTSSAAGTAGQSP